MSGTATARGEGENSRGMTGSGPGVEPGSGTSGQGPVPAGLAHPATAPEAPASGWARTGGQARRARDLALRHVFAVALILAVALRAAVMIGFQPIFWYPDSFWYVRSALGHGFNVAKPGGYSEFLAVLQPLHSFTLVALLQHLMGLGMGIAIYALLRHRGLPGWAATLPALPVLFDAFQIQLEHMLMSDTLFLACVVLAIVILCWRDRPSVRAAGLAGVLLGYATLTRSTGLPLLAVVAACLLIRGPAGARPRSWLARACCRSRFTWPAFTPSTEILPSPIPTACICTTGRCHSRTAPRSSRRRRWLSCVTRARSRSGPSHRSSTCGIHVTRSGSRQSATAACSASASTPSRCGLPSARSWRSRLPTSMP